MSRVRTRPTRDATCEKLFEAAARVFEEQGIGGASIEAIAAAAGFTRGAFYSNFNSKDELIIAMLEDHVEQSIRRNLDLLAVHKNLADFIESLKAMDRTRQDPLGRSPLLHIEMILYVARAEERRPDRDRRQQAHGNSDRKGKRVAAGQIVQSARDPWARGAACQCHEHDGAKDAAVMPALENLEHHRAHDRGQPVAERALREYHQV